MCNESSVRRLSPSACKASMTDWGRGAERARHELMPHAPCLMPNDLPAQSAAQTTRPSAHSLRVCEAPTAQRVRHAVGGATAGGDEQLAREDVGLERRQGMLGD